MKWIIRAYALILLAYTGWRTYDFMLHQLPNDETGHFLALLFLFATEAGLALWHEISLRHTSTQEQHYTAIALTWLDFAGSLVAGIADMIIRQTLTSEYVIPPLLVTVLIYGLPLVVAINVAGVLIYLTNDGELQLDRAKRQLRFEITRQAIKELQANQGAIAEGMKKDIYKQLRDDVTGRMAKEYLKAASTETRLNPDLPVPGRNGHKPEMASFNAEAEASDRPNVDLGKVKGR